EALRAAAGSSASPGGSAMHVDGSVRARFIEVRSAAQTLAPERSRTRATSAPGQGATFARPRCGCGGCEQVGNAWRSFERQQCAFDVQAAAETGQRAVSADH